MSPETTALVTALLSSHGVQDVTAMMCRSITGEVVSESQVKRIRSKMVKAGASRRPSVPIAMQKRAPKLETVDLPPAGFSSSDMLLRRQLRAGQHFITDPSRFASVCASVGLIL